MLILVIIPLFYLYEFYVHISAHFTGSILPSVITNQWHIVLINIVMFITFLLPLSFRRRINWKEYGIVTAFFVSLFIEMYGLPLTILFVSKTINPTGPEILNIVYHFEFLGVDIALSHAMAYATLLIIIGTIIILVAWVTLYRNIKKDEIVTKGIYSYSRHPQYLGFLMIIIGWLIGWPTILTLVFATILIYMYIRVCKVEEKELSDNKKYKQFMQKVPFLI